MALNNLAKGSRFSRIVSFKERRYAPFMECTECGLHSKLLDVWPPWSNFVHFHPVFGKIWPIIDCNCSSGNPGSAPETPKAGVKFRLFALIIHAGYASFWSTLIATYENTHFITNRHRTSPIAKGKLGPLYVKTTVFSFFFTNCHKLN